MTDEHDTMTELLPTPAAGPRMQMVEVALIEESPTNPRKHFDAVKLQELADSIAATGVHQPVLLRPLPGSRLAETFGQRRPGAPLPTYELVAGARRLRACKLAKVAEVPAMIREMSDQQALEIQVIENLQREDVSPLEEAEGFDALMTHSGMTADQVGAKVGKSRSHVYARLKVLDACYAVRQALREGKGGLDFSKALLIARIPNEQLQIKALEEITDLDWTGDPMSYREAQQYIQRTYMLNLANARFNIEDASLVPSAGNCRECPKRTGANVDLFSDVGNADICTDPVCFHTKESAHTEAAKAQAAASGKHLVDGREAKAMMEDSYSTRVKGHLRLDDVADSPTNETLRELLGDVIEQQGIKTTLIENPRKEGDFIEVLSREQVAELLKAKQADDALSTLKAQDKRNAEAAKEAEKQTAAREYEQGWRRDLLTATWQQISTGTHESPSDAVLRCIALGYAKSLNQEQATKLCKLLGLGNLQPVGTVCDYVKDTPHPADVLQLLLAFRDVEYLHWLPKEDQNTDLLLLAGEFGVDVNAIKAQTKANQRAAAAEKAQAKKKTEQDGAQENTRTPPPAAHANNTRGAKPKKPGRGQGPAAHASDTPAARPSAEAVAAQIAAAMQAIEANPGADAPGIEASPVAGAQATPAPTANACGDESQGTSVDAGATVSGAEPVADADAELLARVRQICIETQRGSISLVQRNLQIGYRKASHLIGLLTADGTLGPVGKDGSRIVLAGRSTSEGAAFNIGQRVRVLDNVSQRQAAHVGKAGTVAAQVGPDAFGVMLDGDALYSFHTTELEGA